MKIAILLFLQLLVASLPLLAVNIDIGGTSITIPSPDGFLPVTGDMVMVNKFLENLVAPQNIRFISFIPQQALPAVQRGEMPDLTHNLSVQTAKTVVSTAVTKADFEQFKKLMRAQNEELVKKIEKESPDILDKINKGVENQFNRNPDFNLNGVIMLPPHDESDRLFAFSCYVNFS